MEEKILKIEEKVLKIEENLKIIESQLESLIKAFLNHSKHTVNSFKATDSNFEVVNKKIDELASVSNKEFKGVTGKLGEIKDELSKIQKVSNYTEEYENLLKIAR